MINCIKTSLKLDIYYAINSFIYNLGKINFFKNVFNSNSFKSLNLKKIIFVLVLVINFLKKFICKILYLIAVFYFSKILFKNFNYFYHIYFIFCILDIIVSTKILSMSKKKYISCILFNMDSKLYIISSLLYINFANLLYELLCFFIINKFISINFKLIFCFCLLTFFGRFIGEAFTMIFYKIKKFIWYYNFKLYFFIIIPIFCCSLFPFIGVSVPNYIIYITTILSIIIGIVSFIYLIYIKDYKTINKCLLSSYFNGYSSNLNKPYGINEIIEVKEKDKDISISKINNKKGYDLFNTIFYERHKSILLNSVFKFSICILLCYLIIGILIYTNDGIYHNIHYLLTYKLGFFVFLMLFINRGSIVTQAMFYNCDHAMLTYNFYRDANVIVNLFKRRLISIIKINLIPSIIISIGNTILLYLTGGSDLITYISSFIFIIMTGVFFSVHYLVLYYLFSPFSRNSSFKKIGYLIAMALTDYFSFMLFFNLTLPSSIFSIAMIAFTIIYSFINIFLVYKFAPRTFKLN